MDKFRPEKYVAVPYFRKRFVFFAELGTTDQTRELEKRMGVTQSLIYRYLETKKDLVEQVYESVYFQRWAPSWEASICDRSIPIRDRMVRFNDSYTSRMFSYEWIRVYLYSGLEGANINKRYIEQVEQRILWSICAGLGVSNEQYSRIGLDVAWGIFYFEISKYFYQTPIEADLVKVIGQCVDALLEGAPSVLRSAVGK